MIRISVKFEDGHEEIREANNTDEMSQMVTAAAQEDGVKQAGIIDIKEFEAALAAEKLSG